MNGVRLDLVNGAAAAVVEMESDPTHWSDMPRKRVSAEELHDLLVREFSNTAGDTCLSCRLPMPVFLETRDPDRPNWRIGSIAECSTLCHTILEDVAAKLAHKYNLR